MFATTLNLGTYWICSGNLYVHFLSDLTNLLMSLSFCSYTIDGITIQIILVENWRWAKIHKEE